MADNIREVIRSGKVSFEKVWKYVMRDFRDKGEHLPNKKIFKNYFYNIIPNIETIKTDLILSIMIDKDLDDITPGIRNQKICSSILGIDKEFYLKRLFGGENGLKAIEENYSEGIKSCCFHLNHFTIQEIVSCKLILSDITLEEAISWIIQNRINFEREMKRENRRYA